MNPTVSVGVPVFNGGRFLPAALDSAIAQTFHDFELIIADNASTDETEEIAREYSRRDSRIRYIRRPCNIGASPNFNDLVSHAKGNYFKWLAHDDTMDPPFLQACIQQLAENSSAVLACPRIRFIDSSGLELERYASPFRTHDENAAVRFAEMLKGHPCYEIFGLIRKNSLFQTRLIGNYNHGDGVLLAHLSLLGQFAEVPEYLFASRRHEKQSMYLFGITTQRNARDFDAYAQWFDPRNKPGLSRSFNKAFFDYARMIRIAPLSFSDRCRCYGVLSRWLVPNWRILAGEWKRTAFHFLPLFGRRKNGIGFPSGQN
jgi:glycosyltransferase involved in cell wall biosynthesis